jgi:hypothetical protein
VETLVSQLAVFDDVQVATARMTALGSASGDQHITAAAADSTQASSTLRDPIE